MSGFSPEWLALREGADHAARDPDLAEAVAGHLNGRGAATIIDLGCGTGSNLRALAPRLGRTQHWTLVDYDAALLAAARERLSQWADQVGRDGERLLIARDGRRMSVTFLQADLNRDLETLLAAPADLVTAAAFFDLVSAVWIERFAAALAARRPAFYTVLTYDGTEDWQPPHPADAAMLDAFLAHQATDKGFGPAAGPAATAALEAAFKAQGYTVATAASPWRLEAPRDGALMAALAEGFADAVAETGRVDSGLLAGWRAARKSAHAAKIGHSDLFARPL